MSPTNSPVPPSSSHLQVRRPETVVARPVPQTREVRHAPQHSGLDRSDILYALFKHKKTILILFLIGIAAAGSIYFLYPPVYESDAKLLVRYVIERSSVDPIDNARGSSTLGQNVSSVLGSEIEILTSWDLAVQAAEAVGPKRILPKSKVPPSKEAAAATVASGLEATVSKGSNIIEVAYRNRDPEVATLVLNELVNRYFNKHLEVHRSAGAFDFVTQQTDQVRARLNQTEDALKDLKARAGIFSLNDSTAAVSSEFARTEERLHMAEAELAEQEARVRQMGGPIVEVNQTAAQATAAPAGSPAAEIPTNVTEQYQSLVSRLPQLRQAKMDLLARFMPENQMVKAKQAEIDEAEVQRRALESQYPDLSAKVRPIASSGNQQQLDQNSEVARLVGLQAKKNALAARLHDLQEQIKQLSQLGPQIADLERQKELEETNYKYFQGTLEKARVDEALDPSKIPNISAIQRPSPPMLVTKKRDKLMMGLAAGGLAAGIAFALLRELILSRAIRRPIEVEKFVGVTPLMSIPYSSRLHRAMASNHNGQPNGRAKQVSRRSIAPWDADHFIRPYAEAIRDRLGLYFELHNLTHKPKLVGVAGVSDNGGTSTLAAGLAAALSETNDGKVLLVDVNLGPDQVHPFFKGRPAYTLNAALKPNGAIDAAAENLYLAMVGSPNAGPAQLGLKKFFDLMPNLKASDFDYIIFDMPSLVSTSPTWGMAPFMDKMLVVVESEKNDRDFVKRSYRRLLSERENVGLVLNKVRSYAPKKLELES